MKNKGNLKITDMKKFKIRIVEILIIIATIILTALSVKLAFIERGYKAIGGEWLVPLTGAVVILILEDQLKEE